MTIKRTKEIKLRFTELEFEELNKRKDGALAVWIRELALGQPMRSNQKIKPPSVSPKLLYQLSAIGNNLNQIARSINSGEYGAGQAAIVKAVLVSIDRELTEIKKQNAR